MSRPRLPVPSFFLPHLPLYLTTALQPCNDWESAAKQWTQDATTKKQLLCWFQLIWWPPPYLSLWLASSSTTTQSKAGLPSTSHSGQSGHSLTSCSSLSEGNCGNHGNLTMFINDSLTMWRQQWDRGGCTQDKVMQAEVCQHAGSWAYLKIKWGNLKIKWGRPHKQGMEQAAPLQGVPTSQLWPSVHVTVQLSTAPNTT